jgi:hypothetical protein
MVIVLVPPCTVVGALELKVSWMHSRSEAPVASGCRPAASLVYASLPVEIDAPDSAVPPVQVEPMPEPLTVPARDTAT